MKKQHDLLGIILAAVTGAVLLSAQFLRAFLPRLILPRLDLPNLVLLCLAALVLEHYFARSSRRDHRVLPLYGALIFGLFPFAAGFTAPLRALVMGLEGAVLLTAVAFLFDNMAQRLASGPASKAAPAISALGLFLAAQILMGIL